VGPCEVGADRQTVRSAYPPEKSLENIGLKDTELLASLWRSHVAPVGMHLGPATCYTD
jgi:hypothetical protein